MYLEHKSNNFLRPFRLLKGRRNIPRGLKINFNRVSIVVRVLVKIDLFLFNKPDYKINKENSSSNRATSFPLTQNHLHSALSALRACKTNFEKYLLSCQVNESKYWQGSTLLYFICSFSGNNAGRQTTIAAYPAISDYSTS